MTPCQRGREVFEFVDDVLSPSQKKEFEAHLVQCKECARLLDRLRRQKVWLKKLSTLHTGDTFFLLLMERIRRERLGKRIGEVERSFPFPRFVPVVAFTLLVFVGMWVFLWMAREKEIARNHPSFFLPSRYSLEHEKVEYVLDELPRSQKVQDRTPMQSIPIDSLFEKSAFSELPSHMRPVSF